MLEGIGIGPAEEQVYGELVAGPATGAREVADRTGLAEPQVEQVIAELERKGLVTVHPGQRRRLHAAPPDITLKLMALQRIDEVHKAQLAIARLAQRYQRNGAPDGAAESVEVVEGGAAVAERHAQLQRDARQEIQSLTPTGPAVAVPAAANYGQRDALRAGVRYRVVYDRALLELGGSDAPLLLEEWAALGEEMRVAVNVPLKAFVFDGRLALVVLDDGPPGEVKALVIHVPTVVRAIEWIFRRVWESAVPVPVALAAPIDGPLAPDDRRLLSLLLAGYTDQVIAVQVGVSMRTIQRRVQRLLLLAGVQTRLQLGWQAAQRHWI
ncbi:helix-turn-helix domain-containing protein [Micromonospora sp. NPDC047074]|uniref:TrmB family transcriptional regulator n=1 Tax=Micromonospora sp. NPDC047074 TaxID=3154339 RepID=UPI0033F8ACE9